jgi:hypothetical protein
MVKLSCKKLKKSTSKSYRKKPNKVRRTYRKMVGGTFTPEENQQLLSLGFTQNDIQILSDRGIGINVIQISLNQINPDSGVNFTPQEIIHDIQNNELHDLDISTITDSPGYSQGSFSPGPSSPSPSSPSPSSPSPSSQNPSSPGSLHLSDLESTYTETPMDMSIGGRKHKSYGKTKKGKKSLKYNRKSRKQRGKQRGKQKGKQKGGRCFGNGVGANSYEPNYSIYNTNMLKLFPYRTQ